MDILLTVIVPMYNIEQYLERCLESLLNQSYKNFNLIIIDDSSTDNSFNIATRFQKSHDNISIYRNNRNMGVSYCRNIGIKLAKTKYIAFLDGDDWIDYNCYSKAINILENNTNIDMVFWDITTVYSRSKYIKRYAYPEENTISNIFALKLFTKIQVSNIYVSPLLGNKIIRSNLIKNNNLEFKGYFYEDDIFIFKCLLFSNKISFISDVNLYYYQRDDSAMHSFSENVIDDLFMSFYDFRTYLIEKKEWGKTEKYFYSYFEKCLKNLLILMRNSVRSESQERKYLLKIHTSFYSVLPISEYVKYCDLQSFPF